MLLSAVDVGGINKQTNNQVSVATIERRLIMQSWAGGATCFTVETYQQSCTRAHGGCQKGRCMIGT